MKGKQAVPTGTDKLQANPMLPTFHPSSPLPVERLPELLIRRDINDFRTIRNVKFEKLCVKL